MRLLCLNLWGGRQGELLFDYLKTQAVETDIFCFQEVFKSSGGAPKIGKRGEHFYLLGELETLLRGFKGFFSPTSRNHDLSGPVDFKTEMGLAVFVKSAHKKMINKVYPIWGNIDERLKSDFTNIARGLQETEIKIGNFFLYVFNYHGIPKPGDKLDTPDRLEQSRKIMGILEKIEGPKILCGDFNLMPETESIAVLEDHIRNLIKDFKIQNTRNEISWEQYHNKQSFADYAFVSAEIKVNNFQAPYNLVSDHLPLILDFSL